MLYIGLIIKRRISPAQIYQRQESILSTSFRLSLIVRSFWFSGSYYNEVVSFVFFIHNGNRYFVGIRALWGCLLCVCVTWYFLEMPLNNHSICYTMRFSQCIRKLHLVVLNITTVGISHVCHIFKYIDDRFSITLSNNSLFWTGTHQYCVVVAPWFRGDRYLLTQQRQTFRE